MQPINWLQNSLFVKDIYIVISRLRFRFQKEWIIFYKLNCSFWLFLFTVQLQMMFLYSAAKQTVYSRRTVSRSSYLHQCNSWADKVRYSLTYCSNRFICWRDFCIQTDRQTDGSCLWYTYNMGGAPCENYRVGIHCVDGAKVSMHVVPAYRTAFFGTSAPL